MQVDSLEEVTIPGTGHRLGIVVPAGWRYREMSVPSLRIPRELFTLGTSLPGLVPAKSDQPRPMVQDLAREDVLLWAYAQLPADHPPPEDTISDWSPWQTDKGPVARLIFQFERFERTDAREWAAADFSWRRTGFSVNDVQVTIWLWLGTAAAQEALTDTESALASMSLTGGH